MKDLAIYLDLANHKSISTKNDIEDLCQNVLKYKFHSAFVNPCWVRLAKIILNKASGHKAQVGTVVSFPLGQETTELKVLTCRHLIKKGADELDISTNLGWLKNDRADLYLKEMKRIVQASKALKKEVVIKFIIETGRLTDKQIQKASSLVLQAQADFVKTCSGFGPRGATLNDVKLIKKAVKDKIKIKAAGGIKTKKQALAFIKAGASRIGTSKAVEIIQN